MFGWPSSSSWWRMAPTRPSIMSEGATMSAPASAWEIAVRASSSSGDVVVDLALADEAAVPVRRVLAEADVGDHHQVRMRLLQRAHRHLHDALVVVGARAGLVLRRRDAEQDHGADAGGLDLGRLGDELADREALDAGHRLHGLADVLAGDHEQRLHEVARRQLGLAHEVTKRARAAQAPHARSGKAHAA